MFCFHDWEEKRRVRAVHIELQMRQTFPALGCWCGEEFVVFVTHRVCLKCGHVDNEIERCEIVLKRLAKRDMRQLPKVSFWENVLDLSDVFLGWRKSNECRGEYPYSRRG